MNFLRRISPTIVVISVAAALWLTALAWWFQPWIRFHYHLLTLSVDTSGRPLLGSVAEAEFAVNTFSDEVSSSTIGELYYASCRRLEGLRGGVPRRTYLWSDAMGYPRVSSVVELPQGHMAVTASNNNDNDRVSVSVAPGLFPPIGHPGQFIGVKELPNDRLPPGILRP